MLLKHHAQHFQGFQWATAEEVSKEIPFHKLCSTPWFLLGTAQCFLLFVFLQAAIGSVALDTARTQQEETLEQYGMDVLTVAFLAILITAPIGALIIGLAGPRLLHKADAGNDHHGPERTEEIDISGRV